MIKIRYTDLPEGLHGEVRQEGAKTSIHLAPGLSRAQRRAALTKARQAGRVGRSVPLPAIPFALAIGADRIKITLRAAVAAARVHPVAFAVPAAILITAVISYTFVASVTIHLSRHPQALGRGAVNATTSAAPVCSPWPPRQPPSPHASTAAAPGGSAGPLSGPSGQQHQPPRPVPLAVSSSPRPDASAAPSAGPTVPAAPSATPTPTPSSSADDLSNGTNDDSEDSGVGSSDYGVGSSDDSGAGSIGGSGANGSNCVQAGPVQVCAYLRFRT